MTELPGLEPESDEEVTLTCDQPNCGHQVTGKPKGRGSAPMLMGQHKYAKHGLRGEKNGQRRKAGQPTEEEREARPVTAAIRDATTAVRKGQGAPSATDLSNFAGKLLGMGTMAVATHMVQTDPGIPEGPDGDREREWLTDQLVLDERAASQLFAPVGRVVAPTKINQKFGRKIIDNADVIDSALTLVEFAANWRQYLRTRGVPRVAEPTGPFVPYVVASEEAVNDSASTSATPQAPAASPPQTTSGTGMSSGMLVTPQMIQAARRGRQAEEPS